jgi:hypothetical protein
MIGPLVAIGRALLKVAPEVVPLVVELVSRVAASPNPRLTAERALQATVSEQGAEALIRAQYRGIR